MLRVVSLPVPLKCMHGQRAAQKTLGCPGAQSDSLVSARRMVIILALQTLCELRPCAPSESLVATGRARCPPAPKGIKKTPGESPGTTDSPVAGGHAHGTGVRTQATHEKHPRDRAPCLDGLIAGGRARGCALPVAHLDVVLDVVRDKRCHALVVVLFLRHRLRRCRRTQVESSKQQTTFLPKKTCASLP